jgi:squalene-hopene/tetraprenyl-beta-curcumene cyclase
MVNFTQLWQAYQIVWEDLLAQRRPEGHWEGRLASSALATATAMGALALVRRHGGPAPAESARMISAGLPWLAQTQNPDGGWGDTDRSPSNIATTMLVRAAVYLADPHQDPHAPARQPFDGRFAPMLDRAVQYIQQQGGLDGLRRRYGKDQTFAVPILTMYALAGLTGWEEVRPLPFEWAVLPHRLIGLVRLPVVSYAIPALVAMGQTRFFHRPPRNPLLRWLRRSVVEKTLHVLESKQPASGGFLEAVPLTSFVLMALASTGRACHPVVQRGVDFLLRTFRPEGAWPIDTNLAAWVTTLAVNALLPSSVEGPPAHPLAAEVSPVGHSVGKGFSAFCPAEVIAQRKAVARSCWRWILQCQHQNVHPFTASAPGGWGWTDLPGAVPDADDTAGALLALAGIYRQIGPELSAQQQRQLLQAVGRGLRWLVDLQNRDGGWPTFCRGWGALPFDRSASDLTAHALRALVAWQTGIGQGLLETAFWPSPCPISQWQLDRAIRRGLDYLARSQNPDGSWTPLWFGNAYWPGEENPIYGTARVLLAYRDLGQWGSRPAQKGLAWLLRHQNADGGWGGRPKTDLVCPAQTPSEQSTPSVCPGPPDAPHQADWVSSVEETALAVDALLADPRGLGPERNTDSTDGQTGTLKSADVPAQTETSVQADASASDAAQWAKQGQTLVVCPAAIRQAVERGLAWLVHAIQEGRHRQPEPIGFYFARLWYYEQTYPLVGAASALGAAVHRLENTQTEQTGRE